MAAVALRCFRIGSLLCAAVLLGDSFVIAQNTCRNPSAGNFAIAVPFTAPRSQ
jgi:hypothetical protein